MVFWMLSKQNLDFFLLKNLIYSILEEEKNPQSNNLSNMQFLAENNNDLDFEENYNNPLVWSSCCMPSIIAMLCPLQVLSLHHSPN